MGGDLGSNCIMHSYKITYVVGLGLNPQYFEVEMSPKLHSS